MGRPSLWNNSPANSVRSLRFIFGTGFRELNDRNVIRYVLALRALFFTWAILFAAWLVCL
jgi:hypothetical protein